MRVEVVCWFSLVRVGHQREKSENVFEGQMKCAFYLFPILRIRFIGFIHFAAALYIFRVNSSFELCSVKGNTFFYMHCLFFQLFLHNLSVFSFVSFFIFIYSFLVINTTTY